MGMSRGNTETTLGRQQIHHDGQGVPGVVRGRDVFVELEHCEERQGVSRVSIGSFFKTYFLPPFIGF